MDKNKCWHNSKSRNECSSFEGGWRGDKVLLVPAKGTMN